MAMTTPAPLPPRQIDCFKAYDVRGRLGSELDSDVAYRIGRAFAEVLAAREVIVGRDTRETSPELAQALIRGLNDGGANVRLAGVSGKIFANGSNSYFGAIAVLATHVGNGTGIFSHKNRTQTGNDAVLR